MEPLSAGAVTSNVWMSFSLMPPLDLRVGAMEPIALSVPAAESVSIPSLGVALHQEIDKAAVLPSWIAACESNGKSRNSPVFEWIRTIIVMSLRTEIRLTRLVDRIADKDNGEFLQELSKLLIKPEVKAALNKELDMGFFSLVCLHTRYLGSVPIIQTTSQHPKMVLPEQEVARVCAYLDQIIVWWDHCLSVDLPREEELVGIFSQFLSSLEQFAVRMGRIYQQTLEDYMIECPGVAAAVVDQLTTIPSRLDDITERIKSKQAEVSEVVAALERESAAERLLKTRIAEATPYLQRLVDEVSPKLDAAQQALQTALAAVRSLDESTTHPETLSGEEFASFWEQSREPVRAVVQAQTVLQNCVAEHRRRATSLRNDFLSQIVEGRELDNISDDLREVCVRAQATLRASDELAETLKRDIEAAREVLAKRESVLMISPHVEIRNVSPLDRFAFGYVAEITDERLETVLNELDPYLRTPEIHELLNLAPIGDVVSKVMKIYDHMKTHGKKGFYIEEDGMVEGWGGQCVVALPEGFKGFSVDLTGTHYTESYCEEFLRKPSKRLNAELLYFIFGHEPESTTFITRNLPIVLGTHFTSRDKRLFYHAVFKSPILRRNFARAVRTHFVLDVELIGKAVEVVSNKEKTVKVAFEYAQSEFGATPEEAALYAYFIQTMNFSDTEASPYSYLFMGRGRVLKLSKDDLHSFEALSRLVAIKGDKKVNEEWQRRLENAVVFSRHAQSHYLLNPQYLRAAKGYSQRRDKFLFHDIFSGEAVEVASRIVGIRTASVAELDERHPYRILHQRLSELISAGSIVNEFLLVLCDAASEVDRSTRANFFGALTQLPADWSSEDIHLWGAAWVLRHSKISRDSMDKFLMDKTALLEISRRINLAVYY